MRLIDCKKFSNIEYFSWGDIHGGARSTCLNTIKSFVEIIKEKKNRFFSLVGDLVEGKTPDNPHFDLDIHTGKGQYVDALIQKQCDMVVEWFKPIADRCIFISPGGHELKPNIRNVFKPITYIAHGLGLEEGQVGHFLNVLDFPKFKIMDWHGDGTSNPRAGRRRQIRQAKERYLFNRMWQMRGDCLVKIQHHGHQIVISKPEWAQELIYENGKQVYKNLGIRVNDGAIHEEDVWYCMSGTAMRTYIEDGITYGEQKGYAPTQLGCIKVIIKNGFLENIEKVYL
jgi:hypothetical protein